MKNSKGKKREKKRKKSWKKLHYNFQLIIEI